VEPTGDDGLAAYQPPATASFSDVPVEHWSYRYVEYLAERGIVSGYENGSYLPEKIVNRGEAAVYLARAFNLTLP
jgi:hypothetical protein